MTPSTIASPDRLEAIKNYRKEHKSHTTVRQEVAAAKVVFDRIGHVLLRQPGVTAVDIGFQILDGQNQFTGEVALRVHVENKLPLKRLWQDGRESIAELNLEALSGGLRVEPCRETRTAQLKEFVAKPDKPEPVFFCVPDPCQKPTAGGKQKEIKVPIDIIEARYLPAAVEVTRPQLSDRHFDDDDALELSKRSVHPVVGGISVGAAEGPAGTIGAVVWDETDGTPCLLSNWHVLASTPSARAGQPCYQPAIFDGGNVATDVVGALKRWHLGQEGDAALAEMAGGRTYCAGEVLGLHSPVTETVEPELGMRVRKWGRTTGFVKGFIDGVHLTINIPYSYVGVRKFSRQIHVAPLESGIEVSAQGDSGGLWVTKYLPLQERIDAGVETFAEQHQEMMSGKPSDSGSVSGSSDSKNETPCAKGPPLRDRVYYAVALHFAGDAPGAKSGEFAVASPIRALADRLRFSFRPVFFAQTDLVLRDKPAISPAPEVRPPSAVPAQPGAGEPSRALISAEPTPRVPPP